jgi:adenylate cyclase
MRWSLRSKWTLALVIVGAAPLAIASVTALRLQRRGLLDSERALAVAAIDEVGGAVDKTLTGSADAAEQISRLLTDARISDQVRLALAQQVFENTAELATVAFYGMDGRFMDAFVRTAGSKPNPVAVPATMRPSSELADGAGEWLAVEIADATPWLRYATVMKAEDNPTGILVAVLDPTRLSQVMGSISMGRYGRSDRLVVTDANARVILAPQGSPQIPGTSLAGRDVFRSLHLPISSGTGFALTTEFAGEDGIPMVGTLRLLATQGWVVAVRRPEREAFTTLAQTRRTLLLVGAALAGLALVFGLILGTRSTRPIRRLVSLVESYRRHELSARSDVRTGDEVQLLGEALGTMAEGLAAGEKEIARRATVESTMSRYLPASIAESIAEGKTKVVLGGQRRPITVLFADVSSFTRFAESAPPEQVVVFLNQLFSVLSEVVFRHGGMVDKFIGDCIMAVFGAPPQEDDHAARALAAAEDLHRFTEAHAPAWQSEFSFAVTLGIGVATGEALVGNLGSEARMEYTAIGDVVNVAARLESLARGGQTLLTAETARAAGRRFPCKSLGPCELRGKSKPVEIMELA